MPRPYQPGETLPAEDIATFREALGQQHEALAAFKNERAGLLADLNSHLAWFARQNGQLRSNADQWACRERFEPFTPRLRAMQKHVGEVAKLSLRALELAEKKLNPRRWEGWDGKTIRSARETLEAQRDTAIEILKMTLYFFHQVTWLHSRFPEATYQDVLGLCKVVTLGEIA